MVADEIEGDTRDVGRDRERVVRGSEFPDLVDVGRIERRVEIACLGRLRDAGRAERGAVGLLVQVEVPAERALDVVLDLVAGREQLLQDRGCG